ncbi:molluscan insulin-related peptide 1-like [Physella acuta]|uniref:molluscan insulin-related peptide 1-like n=1 Tax=Physella acuta TaxID=109671 RepID=UPI0027DB517B|nr:molluscan insulin-related peptide 1-like [Physella acuta]
MSVPSPFALASVLISILAFGACGVEAQDYSCSYHDRPHPHGLCGSKLSDTVHTICAIHGLRVGKRDADTDGDEKLNEFLLAKKSALTYLSKRQNRGITCECCYKTCTTHEILGYCV